MTRRVMALCVFALFLAVFAPARPAAAQVRAPVEWKAWTNGQERKFGDITVKADDRRTGEGYFYIRILKGAQEVMTLSSAAFLIHEPTLGQDIGGSGEPHLAALEWSGNDNCCYQLHIIELGAEPRVVGDIDIKYIEEGGFPTFADRDGKPGLEIEVTDMWAFYADLLAGSPVPRVVLRLVDGAYVADGTLMKKPPPADAALIARADQSHDTYEEAQVGQVWSEFIASPVIELIYQGNLAAACRFHERAHPDDDYKEASLIKLLEDINVKTRREEWKLWPALARANGIPEGGTLDCPR